ncbi:FixH family protein [Alkalicoccobacillus gibsonii]|uniref:FixH family protein n=1 Tax=Alkalicoccobacillus gibsonii TaxID=79881 RepID=UPI001932826D|nr:FixH family protein [Alkalicoccobacillus gibsonii]MBM0066475.1 FixH family protein [Alkalicoccobacillus gibsonii]
MKRKRLVILFISTFLLSACNTSEPDLESIIPDIIEVQIDLPESSPPNEKLKIPVNVTQGDEPVDDARDVVIEIWKDQDRENGFLEEAKHQSDGLYQIDYTFEEDGIYLVQAHVTARDMHSMPTKPIFVGDVSEDEINDFNEAGGAASEQQGESQHH